MSKFVVKNDNYYPDNNTFIGGRGGRGNVKIFDDLNWKEYSTNKIIKSIIEKINESEENK